jgi:hypothetical protein
VTDLWRAMSSELLKLKRTLALRLAVGAPLAVVILTFMISSQRRAATTAEVNPLLGFAQLNLTTWTIIVLPLYAALAATLVAGIEHQHDNWKHLLALPVSRVSIFAAKWLALAGLLLVSALALPLMIVAAAWTLRAMQPALRDAAIPAVLVTARSLQVFCAAGWLASIQMWVSLRWRSQIVGLALGIIAIMVLLGGVARAGLGTIVVYLYPWALPPTAMARMWEIHADRLLVAMWGIAGGAIVAALGCWRLSRRDGF